MFMMMMMMNESDALFVATYKLGQKRLELLYSHRSDFCSTITQTHTHTHWLAFYFLIWQ